MSNSIQVLCLPTVAERVTESISKKLRELPPSSLFPCIYRVPHSVRVMNPQCYTPRLVSIGPLHHDEPRLKPMEQLKLRFYKSFLERIPEREGAEHIMATQVQNWEGVIRQHYQDEIKLVSNEFCTMILLDSVFIVELLLRKEANDPMLNNRWFFRDLLNDILLIENQIPLFVAEYLHKEYYLKECRVCINFPDLVRGFIKDAKKVPKSLPLIPKSDEPAWGQRHFIEYLLLAHISKDQEDIDKLDPSTLKPAQSSFNPQDPLPSNHEHTSPMNSEDHLITIPAPLNSEHPPPQTKMKSENWRSGVFTALKLQACGVKFKAVQTTVLVNIEFKKKEGILTIPRVKVNEWTENLFRNLVAFEQCHHVIPRYASDYLIFMDGLIDTPEDVNILTSAGIIRDDLQDPIKASDIFNNLSKEVLTEGKVFLFDKQSRELNDYRRDLLHKWKETWYNSKFVLQNKYFTSPWSFVSFLAAVLLLGLTIIQTICSIYQAKQIKMK